MNIKNVILKPTILLFFSIFYFALFQNKSFSTSAYYIEDDKYESSSVYATVEADKTPVKINQESPATQTIDGEGAKKIYNTIIIRSKKDNNKTTTQPTEKPVKQENNVATVKNDNKGSFKEKIKKAFKDASNKASNPFYQKKPDTWYIYGIATYGLSSDSTLKLSSVDSNGEKNGSTSITDTISSKTEWKGSGFGLLAGIKTYFFKREKAALFIAPEFYYTQLDLNQNSVAYNTKQYTLAIAAMAAENHVNYGSSYILPVEFSMKPKDMLGGSFRVGITFCNAFSLFGKANLGVLRSNVSLTPRADLIDWDNLFVDGVDEHDKQAIQRRILLDITTKLDGGTVRNTYVYEENYRNKTSLSYGFGVGVEATFWNQHLVLRVDYDHYWTTGSFTVSGTKYPRMTAQGTVSATSNGLQTINDGSKWRVKTNFGTIKFGVGISI